MHLLSAIWLVSDSIPNNLPPDAGKKLDGFIKIAVPLLCALVPTTAAAVIKWLQDHDLRRRRVALTDDLTKLAKSLAELPQAPEFEAVERMRLALHAEMELGVRDLLQMQAHAPRRPVGVSSIAPGLKAMFLWWRPRGFAAWMLHLAFYSSLVFLAFMTLGMSVDSSEKKEQAAQRALEAKLAPRESQEAQKPPVEAPTSAGTVVVIYVLFGVPPLIFRYWASGIHRRQCQADAARLAAVRSSADASAAAQAAG
ncbi:MAG TPA: hypothetical protein VIM62_00180 [Acidobacteriaceae bacterium]